MAEDSKLDDSQATPSAPTPPPPRRGAIFAWMQLLRVPNLFTVPGDPLAGYLLAVCANRLYEPIFFGGWWFDPVLSLWGALAAAAASLFLYAAGLVHNDICDLAEDRIERPHRPLPSGRISLKAAWAAWWLLLLLGLGFAAAACWASMAVAVVLAATIWVYNRYAKRVSVLGPLLMGLCRGLSMLLGVVAVTSDLWKYLMSYPAHYWLGDLHWPLGFMWGCVKVPVVSASLAGMTLYIAAVTQIARGETRARSLGLVPMLPYAFLIAWFGVATSFAMPSCLSGSGRYAPPNPMVEMIPFGVLAVLATAWAAYCGLRLKGTPGPARVQRTVGMLIRGLLPIQAALAALMPWPGWIVAAALLLCWPLAGIVGKRFYGS